MFISPCCFGHLIKKGHKIVDSSQLQNRYKTAYCMDVSLSVYTHCTRHQRCKHSGGSWDDIVWVAEMTKGRINRLFPI